MVRNELKWVMKNVVEDGKPKLLEDVQKFVMTAPGPDLGERPEFSTLPQRKSLVASKTDQPSLFSSMIHLESFYLISVFVLFV